MDRQDIENGSFSYILLFLATNIVEAMDSYLFDFESLRLTYKIYIRG